MKNLNNNRFFNTLWYFILPVSLLAFEPQIKLAGRKDLVLGIETRQTVLDLAAAYLAAPADDILPVIENLIDPFAFKTATPVLPVLIQPDQAEVVDEAPLPDYEDAEVLERAAANFAPKVRGAIMLGDAMYLQLQGGVLLKRGTSFPVRLPQARQQLFTLTLAEITLAGYVLQVGDASKRMTLNQNAGSADSRIQVFKP